MSAAPERTLKLILNTWTLRELPSWSAVPRLSDPHAMVGAIGDAGYAGLQMAPGDPLMAAGSRAGVIMHATGRVIAPGQAREMVLRHQDLGFSLTTIHLGTGFEDQAEGWALAEAVLDAAQRHDYPLLVETHRATMTQDPRRTLDLIARYPALRMNADFSHWYTGCEMRYGDWDAKLAMLQPVFDRTAYLHGRIGDSGAMQVPVVDRDAPNVRDFRTMWTRAMRGFLDRADSVGCLFFAPELLPNTITIDANTVQPAYARQRVDADGVAQDDSDRWQQALELASIARGCFQAAMLRQECP